MTRRLLALLGATAVALLIGLANTLPVAVLLWVEHVPLDVVLGAWALAAIIASALASAALNLGQVTGHTRGQRCAHQLLERYYEQARQAAEQTREPS